MKGIVRLLEDACAGASSIILIVYGLTKRTQFNLARTDLPLSEMSGSQIMWAFYGHSKPFSLLIGGLQIVSALLILVPRTRILGAFLASAILINIILQDIFYGVSFHALAVAIQIQLMLFGVMFFRREKIAMALALLSRPDRISAQSPGIMRLLLKVFLSLMLVAFVFATASIFL